MILNTNERGEVLQSQLLAVLAPIEHYCATRHCAESTKGVWLPRQVHGKEIAVVDEHSCVCPDLPSTNAVCLEMPVADAVITRMAGQWIGVRTADCVPVLLADPVRRVVAAVHAGWRGTVAHIVRLTVERMIAEMGCRPADLYAAIGPSIGPEAFEVGEEVAAAFCDADRQECVLRQVRGPMGLQPLAKPHVDLWQSNVMDLLEAGAELEHIDCTPWCTFERNDVFFSARREGIQTGRIVSAIRIGC